MKKVCSQAQRSVTVQRQFGFEKRSKIGRKNESEASKWGSGGNRAGPVELVQWYRASNVRSEIASEDEIERRGTPGGWVYLVDAAAAAAGGGVGGADDGGDPS